MKGDIRLTNLRKTRGNENPTSNRIPMLMMSIFLLKLSLARGVHGVGRYSGVVDA